MKEPSVATLAMVEKHCAREAHGYRNDHRLCPLFMQYGHVSKPQPAAIFVYVLGDIDLYTGLKERLLVVDYYGETDNSMAAVDYNRRRLALPIHPTVIGSELADWLEDEDNQYQIAKILENSFFHWKDGKKLGVFVYEGDFDKDEQGYLRIECAKAETLADFLGGTFSAEYDREKNEVTFPDCGVVIPLSLEKPIAREAALDMIVEAANDLNIHITDATPCALLKIAQEAMFEWLDENEEA